MSFTINLLNERIKRAEKLNELKAKSPQLSSLLEIVIDDRLKIYVKRTFSKKKINEIKQKYLNRQNHRIEKVRFNTLLSD